MAKKMIKMRKKNPEIGKRVPTKVISCIYKLSAFVPTQQSNFYIAPYCYNNNPLHYVEMIPSCMVRTGDSTSEWPLAVKCFV